MRTDASHAPVPPYARGLLVLGAAILLVAAVVIGLVAASAAVWRSIALGPSPPPSTTPLSNSSRSATQGAAALSMHLRLVVDPPPLLGVRAPDGQVHDAFVPPTFTMTAGKVYVVTVLNYDPMPHTWTAPSLGVNAPVPPGSHDHPSVTHFTIRPTKAGTYVWFCATPCDPWSMVHNGYMRGTVTVVA
jgi:hypothetical protein